MSVGARVPFAVEAFPGRYGVARLYDQSFDEAETALLEAVAATVEHALDRLRLGEERDRLYLEAHRQGKARRG